jgi:hypothetical protein
MSRRRAGVRLMFRLASGACKASSMAPPTAALKRLRDGKAALRRICGGAPRTPCCRAGAILVHR